MFPLPGLIGLSAATRRSARLSRRVVFAAGAGACRFAMVAPQSQHNLVVGERMEPRLPRAVPCIRFAGSIAIASGVQ